MPQPTREGKPVPQVKFRYRADNEWKEITSDQLFKGRTVAVFSLQRWWCWLCRWIV